VNGVAVRPHRARMLLWEPVAQLEVVCRGQDTCIGGASYGISIDRASRWQTGPGKGHRGAIGFGASGGYSWLCTRGCRGKAWTRQGA
jgi:hypothetical protein